MARDFPAWHTDRKAGDPPKTRKCPKCHDGAAAKHHILCDKCLASESPQEGVTSQWEV